ncbi:hypothetical protein [Amycolatopsis taiwanensis]|uniref:HTH cro/C1-type domain-containing protein n=1 Tax=Amycolatopsis taiwanensis TaxID=342230 RepID=A0A9W6VCJ3_9PSEU|nr:hypothetical protein [Amycolatopsis taiwanensis]GLY63815.1 hypothetical protein Atai01_04340 [Amycolatopsis taiwanensis]
MAEPDWAAVAKAIRDRMLELDLLQEELARRSNIAPATIRELEYNTVQRRRGKRTLRALSTALEWHADHLDAVKSGQPPPEFQAPDDSSNGAGGTRDLLRELLERVAGIEEKVRDLHRKEFGG